MQPMRTHRGQVIPLDRANVDTDQIIPKQFLKRIERTGYGPFLFNDWRYDDGRQSNAGLRPQPGALQPRQHPARRERTSAAAPRASTLPGRSTTSESSSSSPPRLPTSSTPTPPTTACSPSRCPKPPWPSSSPTPPQRQLRAHRQRRDPHRLRRHRLERQFPLDSFRQHCLLNGLDQIGITLQKQQSITDYEARPALY